MSISRKLINGTAEALGLRSGETYVDDVFSTYLYKGSTSIQQIENGIDLMEASSGWSATEYPDSYRSNNNYSNHSAGRYVFEWNKNHLIHYGTSGSVLWQKEYQSGVKIQTVACNENFVVVGLNLIRPSLPANLHFIVYDHDGVLQWEYSFEKDNGSAWNATGAYIDSDDNVYATYQYGGSTGQGHIMKLDDSGSLLWNRAYESSTQTECNFDHIAKSPNGNLFAFGEARVSSSSVEALGIKLDDSNGSVLWSRRFYTGSNDTNGRKKVGSIDVTDTQITVSAGIRQMQNGSWAYLPQILRIDPSNGDLTSSVVVSSESGLYFPANSPAPSMLRAQDGGLIVSTTGRYTTSENLLVAKFTSDTNLTPEWSVEISGDGIYVGGGGGDSTISEFGSKIFITNQEYEISLPSDGSAVKGTAGELSIRPVPLVRPSTSTASIATPAWSATNPSTFVVVGSTSITSTAGNETIVSSSAPASGESGGLVWIKTRTAGDDHYLYDTERGTSYNVRSNKTNAQQSTGHFSSFNSSGFSLTANTTINDPVNDYVSWTFRKAPKFFDVVTYVGNSVSIGDNSFQSIPHNLGVEPGMIITKSTSQTTDWWIYHVSMGNGYTMMLNDDEAKSGPMPIWNNFTPTDTEFQVGGGGYNVNEGGQEYVAYVFAHDDSEEGLIQCGSYTGNGGTNEIDLGWEPQFVMIKGSSGDGDWQVVDTMRGIVTGDAFSSTPASGDDTYIRWNDPREESAAPIMNLTPTGFVLNTNWLDVNGSTVEYVYMAIRRPNKPAEEFESLELFAISESAGTTSDKPISTGFPVDLGIFSRTTGGVVGKVFDRLRGGSRQLSIPDTTKEYAANDSVQFDDNSGVTVEGNMSGVNDASSSLIDFFWRRAPGFFDVVTYEGSVIPLTLNHNLGVEPEMYIVKCRSSNEEYTGQDADWWVAVKGAASSGAGSGYVFSPGLNTYNAVLSNSNWGLNGEHSSTKFSPFNATLRSSTYRAGQTPNKEYIAYLFASVPGLCDIGSYTGTGGDQEIDCGFTNGARWLLIKRTDAVGHWNLFYNLSASGTDWLYLDDTNGKFNTSEIKTVATGFSVGNETQVNSNNGEYIYYAIA